MSELHWGSPAFVASLKTPLVSTTGENEGGDGSLVLDLKRAPTAQPNLNGGIIINVHELPTTGNGWYVVLRGESGQTLLDAQVISETTPAAPQAYYVWREQWAGIGKNERYTNRLCRFDINGTATFELACDVGHIFKALADGKWSFSGVPIATPIITGSTTTTLANLQAVVRQMLAAGEGRGIWDDQTT